MKRPDALPLTLEQAAQALDYAAHNLKAAQARLRQRRADFNAALAGLVAARRSRRGAA